MSAKALKKQFFGKVANIMQFAKENCAEVKFNEFFLSFFDKVKFRELH